MEFKVGDRVRHVEDGEGSFGEGEVVRIGRNKVHVDWFNDSLDREMPSEDLELVEDPPNRTFKVGDKVRLVGETWDNYGGSLRGEVVTIDEIRASGTIWAGAAGSVGKNGALYSEDNPEGSGDYRVELVDTQPARPETTPTGDSFEQNVRRILGGVADTVVGKNLAYGDSALNPIRVFSKAGRMEQLYTRIDDKLSRVQRGHEYPGDDTLRDIIGYATLILIAQESN